ncbi:hypothetical protein JZ751_014394 [Albula glossodonta]|uniref:Uncharacterized protein n=1 Tax=Albula glossodonta TaxID=121402 RepID=A0A8T2N0D4_9TELE|nr:hypothetical protein JZ751_014394 [Albula glossodonta]
MWVSDMADMVSSPKEGYIIADPGSSHLRSPGLSHWLVRTALRFVSHSMAPLASNSLGHEE